MVNSKEICKLCKKCTKDEDVVAVDNQILKTLEFLLIDLGKCVEENTFICLTCEEKIENVADFKSWLLILTKSDKKNPNSATRRTQAASSEIDMCHLCKNFVDEPCMVSLSKLLEDNGVMKMFQRHIQEVDLGKVVESSMVCDNCEISLANFSSLIASWSRDHSCFDMKGTISNSATMEDYNGGSLNLSSFVDNNSVTNSYTIKENQVDEEQSTNEKDVKCRIDSISFCNTVVVKEEIEEYAGRQEMEMLQLKHEEIDIKEENEVNVNKRTDLITHEQNPCKDDKEVESDRSIKCSYQTTQNTKVNRELRGRLMNDKSLENVQIYKCEKCSFNTKYKGDLKTHLKQHEISKKLQLYKCNHCGFETKWKYYLAKHLLNHKSVVQMYKCEICPFETKYPANMNNHLKLQKIKNEVQMYKCCKCSHKTRYKANLFAHMITHKSSSEVQMYECEKCTFETKHEVAYKRHLRIHQSLNEVKTYKCEECMYITKFKAYLTKHMLKHRSPNEVKMYKCGKCSYETKLKDSLIRHLFSHQTEDKVQIYKCDECSYETRNRKNFCRHLRVHKRDDEVRMHKCEKCSFETRYWSSLKYHLPTHQSLKEVETYSCKTCSYKTIYKQALKKHFLKHKSIDEVRTYNCEKCAFKTKFKRSLCKHLQMHKECVTRK